HRDHLHVALYRRRRGLHPQAQRAPDRRVPGGGAGRGCGGGEEEGLMRAPAGARDGRKPMLKAALLAGAVLALAACGGDKGESARKSEVAGGANASGTASASAAAAPAASPGSPAQRMQLDPGQWEITVQTKMSGKGMPPEVAS